MVASVGLQSIPGMGDVYGSLTVPVGYDAIAGVSMSGTWPATNGTLAMARPTGFERADAISIRIPIEGAEKTAEAIA